MSYRCPLCLKTLNEKEQLTRHCTFHPERDETFKSYPHLIPNKIFCPVSDCQSVNQIEQGVFLCHKNCEEPNPFWNGERVEIPGEANQSRVGFSIDFDGGTYSSVQVQHWLLGILRALPGRMEMWFPLMLLRATAERNGSSRVGRFIELAGARAAGKTILALQAMNPHGYADGAVYNLNNFIFSRRVGGFEDAAFVNFIQTLHLNTLFRLAHKELFLPRGTPPGPRNLRVAFFKPIDPGSTDLPEVDRNVKGHLKRLFGLAQRGIINFLKSDLHASVIEIFGSQGYHPYWHSLALYDKSGEFDENEDVMRDTLDKVAVVINATEFFTDKAGGQPSPENSIQVAVQRLSKAVERKQLCYLVLTQLDRAKVEMGADDWQTVMRLADDITDARRDRGWLRRKSDALFPAHPTTERLLVEKWLRAYPTENRLRLMANLRDIEDIFFIWTEYLPSSSIPATQSQIPISHGLAKFVCRCMDIKWEQIGRK